MNSKKMMSIDLKLEIIQKHEKGMRVVDLAREYGRNKSMICSILKKKELIKTMTPAKGVTLISKLRTPLHDKMEKLLMVWVTEKQLQGGTLTQRIICEKARVIYGDLLKENSHTFTNEKPENSFKASAGWFENFKKRTGIHSVVRHGEAASSDVKAAEVCIKTFSELIESQGDIPQQVFNCDETGLFGKRMPKRTYITAEEKTKPGHKPMKDRLTLALCANASGDCKKVSKRTLTSAWKKLWPEAVAERAFEGSNPDELDDLHTQQHERVQRKSSVEREPVTEEAVPTKLIKELLGHWEKVREIMAEIHPDQVRSERAAELYEDACITRYRNILKRRRKQTSLDSFFKRSASENSQIVTKKVKTNNEN